MVEQSPTVHDGVAPDADPAARRPVFADGDPETRRGRYFDALQDHESTTSFDRAAAVPVGVAERCRQEHRQPNRAPSAAGLNHDGKEMAGPDEEDRGVLVADGGREDPPEALEGDHFRAVAQVTSDAVVTIDESSTIRFVNQAIEDQLGYDPDELIGEPLTALMPQALATQHHKGFARYLETGDRNLDWNHVELTGQHADGYTVPLGISFCEFSLNGDRYFTGILRDISDRGDFEAQRQHEQRVLELVLETMPAGLVIFDETGTILRMNDRAETIAGVSRRTIQEEDDLFSFYDESGEEIPADDLVFRTVLKDGETVFDQLLEIERPDGDRRWVSVNGTRLRDADGDSVTRGIFTLEDVTASQTRATRLRRLTDRIQLLPECESRAGLAGELVETVRETIPVNGASVALYDPDAGSLRTAAAYRADENVPDPDQPRVETHPATTDASAQPARDDVRAGESAETFRSGDPIWEAFIRNETRTVERPADTGGDESAADPEAEPGEAVVASMGQHGVIVVEPDGSTVSSADIREYVDLIAAAARSSFDRVDREADIRTQRDLLQEKTGRLERVEQVNHAIRRITQVLLQAETQQEIEQLVCEELAEVEPYALAWFGHADTETGALEPTAIAGRDQGVLDRGSWLAEGGNGGSPTRAALETGDVTVVNSLLEGEGEATWRETLLDRGFQSLASIPVSFRGTRYGVLNLYAGQPGQFEHLEQAVLQEMSETIGFAMRSLERKHAFVSEHSVELEVRVPNVDRGGFGFLPADRGSVDVENMVLQMNGSMHLFCRLDGIDPATAQELARETANVERFTQITDDSDPLYECTLRGESVVAQILDRGARFESLTLEGGEMTATLRIPQRAEVREYIDLLEEAFGSVDLLAKREVDESVMTVQEFEADVRSKLTARQEEVIQTAFFSGYFEWPRESTGGDVANILGVTQPTVNRHIRSGERTIFGTLYGKGDESEESVADSERD